MDIPPSIIYALLPIFGVVIGVLLQYRFSKAAQETNRLQNLRMQSYVDFVQSISGLAISQKNNDKKKEQEFMILLTDAKARISIYGNKEVIKAIARFWRAGAKIDTPEQMRLFIIICQTIRKDGLLKNQNVPDKEMSQLLFSKDLEKST